MNSLRNERQEEFANVWLNHGRFGILNIAPRMGKCKIAINVFNSINPKSILIAYPDNKIRKSWEDEFVLWNYNPENVTYTTHLSLKKYVDESFDIIVLDECHLLSEAQIAVCTQLFKNNEYILGLTGTLSKQTERVLREDLSLCVIATYTIEQAIKEEVIVDYEIVVVSVPLDNVVNLYKGRTEKQKFDSLTWVINKLEDEGKNTKFMRFARMRIFQKSVAKLNKTKQLLSKYPDERILVFCGLTDIADSLGIPSHHSKKDDSQSFDDFLNGEGNHMAVVRIGNTGLTYKPLNRVIINYFDSNSENLSQKIMRCTSMEYDNPGKIAKIYIISTNESVELKWLAKALSMFNKSKITYI